MSSQYPRLSHLLRVIVEDLNAENVCGAAIYGLDGVLNGRHDFRMVASVGE